MQFDYDTTLASLKQKGYGHLFGVHRELKYLVKHLSPNEEVLAAIHGWQNASTWLVALTNKRLWFINVGLIYGVDLSEILLRSVNEVSHSSGLFFCKLTVSTNGAANKELGGVLLKDANHFITDVNDYLASDHNMNVSVADEILKLKQLLDQNLITQAQFDRKRDEWMQ